MLDAEISRNDNKKPNSTGGINGGKNEIEITESMTAENSESFEGGSSREWERFFQKYLDVANKI